MSDVKRFWVEGGDMERSGFSYAVATMVDADPTLANEVVMADLDWNGRSSWKWVRLATGDLMLACYPQGAMYERVTQDNGGIKV